MQKIDSVPPLTRPPQKLYMQSLEDILGWYENNLCGTDFIDPRGMRVRFAPERFPHLIKLLRLDSRQEVNNPQKQVDAIRAGAKSNADFGGYDLERAATLPWIPNLIATPTVILEVAQRDGWAKPGDTLIAKRYDKNGYQCKVLVCRKVGNGILVPITSHPRDHGDFGKQYKVVWP